MARILFVVNAPEFFFSHRLPLALAARQAGFDVQVATGPGEAGEITNLGFAHHKIPLSRSGKNPLAELHSLWALFWLMRRLKPDLVHLVTIKPVLYGGLIARLVRVPAVVAAISGLGWVFVDSGRKVRLVRKAVKALYRLALGHGNIRVIFQNPDDRGVLVELGAVGEQQTVLIRGSGVAMSGYPVYPEPQGTVVVSFAARLLRDKGVLEFVDAARLLIARGLNVRFWLIGAADPGNPSSVTDQDLAGWRDEGMVEVLGHRADIPALFAQSSIVVLPSYREGLPKVLIEAAACGRPVVTTHAPGCRDAIEPDQTGLLVPVRDPLALANAIQKLIEDPDLRQRMGEAGRALAERAFAIEHVVDAHLAVYRVLLSAKR
ncbi:glycosyltransferase family 4 protein [Thioalkalivibrio sp. XN279]|uniref:glycosyltransferase family 4 protein n=1 Tax=Thioalkalivibrio sp. XN279 TaxID=2714953 RepID=UPI0014092B28|nr:glycosyltransferase family 4 protein [Thioalkalivibrio sp. XN279]NHA15449.1 glycosyltransferase family 4 protein [Thioalkalivibrio sp. XN279]